MSVHHDHGAGLCATENSLRSKIAPRDARGVAMHPNQLTVSLATVRKLVDAQFPQWQGLPITQFASQGTVNALFRIGERLAARFLLEPGDVASTRRRLQLPRSDQRRSGDCCWSPLRWALPARVTASGAAVRLTSLDLLVDVAARAPR